MKLKTFLRYNNTTAQRERYASFCRKNWPELSWGHKYFDSSFLTIVSPSVGARYVGNIIKINCSFDDIMPCLTRAVNIIIEGGNTQADFHNFNRLVSQQCS